MTWQYVLMSVIATWGLSYIITQEDGPFGIFEKIRNFDFCHITDFGDITALEDCIERNTPETSKFPLYFRIRNGLFSLVLGIFGCIYCASPYTSAIVIYIIVMANPYKFNAFEMLLWWVFCFGGSNLISSIWEQYYVQDSD